MGWVAPIIMAIATVAGAVETGMGMSKKSPEMPALPSLDTSEQAAKDAQTQQRRAALAAGGNTNVTGGSGILLGSDIGSVSLVGA